MNSNFGAGYAASITTLSVKAAKKQAQTRKRQVVAVAKMKRSV